MTDQQTFIKELTLTRIFDAPRELVWKAWTDPKLLAKWWGPAGVTNPICELDVRPEGAIHIIMVAGEELGELKGARWPMTGVVKEVEEPTRLVFTSNALKGEDVRPILENLNTVTFEEQDEKTKVTVHVQVIHATAEAEGPLAGMNMGWSQSLDKLVNLLILK